MNRNDTRSMGGRATSWFGCFVTLGGCVRSGGLSLAALAVSSPLVLFSLHVRARSRCYSPPDFVFSYVFLVQAFSLFSFSIPCSLFAFCSVFPLSFVFWSSILWSSFVACCDRLVSYCTLRQSSGSNGSALSCEILRCLSTLSSLDAGYYSHVRRQLYSRRTMERQGQRMSVELPCRMPRFRCGAAGNGAVQ